MVRISPDQVKKILLNAAAYIPQHPDIFFVNPGRDFSRIKKISLLDTLLFPMVAASDNVWTELLDFFGEDIPPSPSAMIQRRNQLKPAAFEELFHRFTSSVPVSKKFHGLRLFAVDGTRLNLPYNPNDRDTFVKDIKGRRGINQIHFNALYDILNDIFIDKVLQPVHEMNEKAAFSDFLHRYGTDQKVLFIADRGYASYNIFADAIKHHRLFLIRVPESFAMDICKGDDHWLVSDSEDIRVTVHVGRCMKRQNLQLKNYHCIPKKGHYDFIPPGSDAYDALHLRVVKFPISDNSYEYLVTNLEPHAYPLDTVKELYRIRWGIETAFRHLKYAGSMVHLHSIKKDLLLQEIYAKLTLYNFSSFIKASVEDKVEKTTEKYRYKVNHTQIQKICSRFLKGKVSDVMKLIRGLAVPVRPGRSFQRNLRRQSADTLAYR